MLLKSEEIPTSVSRVQQLVEKHYGIHAIAKPLPGEIDDNYYLITNQGEEYVLKIAPPDSDQEHLQFQNALAIQLKDAEVALPFLVKNINEDFLTIHRENNYELYLRLFSWVPGRLFSQCHPHNTALLLELGKTMGKISKSLQHFDHPYAHRFHKWDPSQADWVKPHLDSFYGPEKKEIASYFYQLFEDHLPALQKLRKGINHNDANDHNVIVTNDSRDPRVYGLIDYGDAIYTHTINELAITLTYSMMGKNDPLETALKVIKGYHLEFALMEEELAVLYVMIGTRLLISVTVAHLNSLEHPDNPYLQISNPNAWDLLRKWKEIQLSLAHYSFRYAAGFEPCPLRKQYDTWLNKKPAILAIIKQLDQGKLHFFDLGIGSLEIGNPADFSDTRKFESRSIQILEKNKADIGIGKYGEVRPIYTTEDYLAKGNSGYKWRTVHLGIDIFVAPGNGIFSPLNGVLHSFQNNAGNKNYGPTIILEHVQDGMVFHTLYGHLSKDSLSNLKIGQTFTKGQQIGSIGNYPENGNWPPHLHFQIILDMLGLSGDYPGVAYYDQQAVWKSICPDPSLFLGLIKAPASPPDSIPELLGSRKKYLGRSMSISYERPLQIVRGYKQYLYDHTGRRFLDMANNVAHVGHEHPRVVAAGSKQMAVLNTNTRYLHHQIICFAEELQATLPDKLQVCHLVNSGSEANELALRMANTYSGASDMVVVQTGYHGNTTGCVDISSYKFDGPGGKGAPEYVQVVPMPDVYRGLHKDGDAGKDYAKYVKEAISQICSQNRSVAGFICESILSCGGQVPLPAGYLSEVYSIIREAGGICIADEVQVGLGRVGKYYWGFELSEVVPDIVTIGKPLGNGHPVAAVVCSEEIAEAFANGMEYFNTFGGNPVSCAIGREVLQIIKDEKLQQHALKIGDQLKTELRSLQQEYQVIGDVRGHGLFLGIELVKDLETLDPAADKAKYLTNRMREFGVLLSTDGPFNNVLKIKPPLCFGKNDLSYFIETMDLILKEDFMKE